MDRRKAFGILGGFVAVAFNELKPAKASGNKPTRRGFTTTGNGPSCRKESHPCEGNQECCSGLICSRDHGFNGNAKRCHKPKVTCGDLNEQCCKNSSCSGDLVCINSTCVEPSALPICGDLGEACCEGGICDGELVCDSGTCETPPPPAQCQTNSDCCCNEVCVDGVCCPPPPTPPTTPSLQRACKRSKSPRRCCIQAVRRACRKQGAGVSPKKHGGGGATCRKRGFRRCRQIFVR